MILQNGRTHFSFKEKSMKMYLHDSATMFRFALRGELVADRVRELEYAWITSKSVLGTKEVVVDVSGVTNADATGIELLSRMRESGARLTAIAAPESPKIVRLLRIPAAPRPSRAGFTAGLKRLLACVRFG